mgnify:CR=1 FL=1
MKQSGISGNFSESTLASVYTNKQPNDVDTTGVRESAIRENRARSQGDEASYVTDRDELSNGESSGPEEFDNASSAIYYGTESDVEERDPETGWSVGGFATESACSEVNNEGNPETTRSVSGYSATSSLTAGSCDIYSLEDADPVLRCCCA